MMKGVRNLGKIYLKPLHISHSVRDLDEAIAFYAKHLDFELVFKMRLEAHQKWLAFMKHGDFELELFQKDGSTPVPAERLHPHEDQKVQGAKHIAFLVDDVDALASRLKSEGVVIAIEPTIMENKEKNVKEKICFFRDPSGINIEIIERIS